MSHPEIPDILARCLAMHEAKSNAYGEETFNNVSSLSKRPNFMYALDRIAEKLTRAYALETQGRLDDMEGELVDMCLFAALAEAMRRDFISDYDKEIDHPILLHAIQRPLPNVNNERLQAERRMQKAETSFGETIG